MRLALIAFALIALPSLATAGIIFDNLALAGGPSAIAGSIGPSSVLGFGAELHFDADTHITGFAVFDALLADADLRFVIFEAVPRSAPLYLGDPIRFAADGTSIADATFKRSPTIDFTFLAGHTYEVGAVVDAPALVPYLAGSSSAGGIVAAESDANFLGYSPPAYLGNGNVQVAVRLYDDAPSAVPAPPALALVGIGLLTIGAASLGTMSRIFA